MALSDYEKQVLAEMEQHLRQQDPDLADTMASSLPDLPEAEPMGPPRRPLSPRRIALGSILAAVGLAVVLIGVTIAVPLWTILLGATGFALMVGGVLLALSADKEEPDFSGKPPVTPSPSTKSSREERQARRRERWQNQG